MGILNWWKRRPSRPSNAEIAQVLDRLVPPAAPPADDELDLIWVRDGYGTRVRARHILFRLPAGASEADHENLLQHAEAVRARAAGGEDFATLARMFTMEPGGPGRGGDLGYFTRERMVKEFEEAAFSLQTGEVSGVVETPFGYHLIKLEARTDAVMQDKAAFRDAIVRRKRQEALRTYLDRLKLSASMQVQRGAERSLREMAKRPGKRPGFWTAKRPMVCFRGGKLTVGEMAGVLSSVSPLQLEQIASASNTALNGFLEDQATRSLIWAEASLSFPRSHRMAAWWTSSDTILVEAAPGARLLWLADFFYSRGSLEEVLQPTILDMREEYNNAWKEGRIAKARWIRIRGTWGFACAAASLTIASVGGVVVALWRLVRGV